MNKRFVIPPDLKAAIKSAHSLAVSKTPGPEREALIETRNRLLAERDRLAFEFKHGVVKP